ncbi:MAG: hybrid sensor histidine kinase/response regulator [Thermodesulforhabdaceae bacterium]
MKQPPTMARKLVSMCALLIVVMTLISTGIGYVLNERRISRECEKLADEHTRHLVQAIALPLWMMEYEEALQICKLFFDTTLSIRSVTISEPNGKVICSETRENFPPSVVRSTEVSYEGVTVGKVKLEFTSAIMEEEVFQLFLFQLVVIGFISVVLLICIAWIVRKTISIPMGHFVQCMKRIASGDYEFPLPEKRSGYHELTLILKEMTNMAEEIRKRENLLRNVNTELQQEIEKREKTLIELKESEAKFRVVMRVASDAVIIARSDGRIDYANRAAEHLFGYSVDELKNMVVCDLFSEADRPILRRYILKREKLDFSVFEMTGLKKDQTPFFAEVSLGRTFESDSPVDLVVAIVRDITWRKEAEKEKEETLERFYRLQKFEAIGTLATGIAHDFNNILTVIMGYTDLARLATPEDSPTQEYLAQVSNACTRARDLVHQIFAIGRPQQAEEITFDPRPLIKETVKFLRASIPSSIAIEYHITEEEIFIKANPSHIQQLLMNLCTNSVHAMESAAEGLLCIGLEKVRLEEPKDCFFSVIPAGDYVRLSVRDTGCGIPEDILPKIFDPYFTTKEPTKGTGLGLSIVRNVIMGCGGDLEVMSEVGKGTTMIVYLPMVHRIKESDEDIKKEEVRSGSGEGKCILFVDDERPIVDLARLTLSVAGYRVCAFTDPREALDYFRNNYEDVNLVITDITMPHIRGDMLAKEISSIKPGVPIIVCTGYGFLFPPETREELGIKEVIHKPFSGKVLIEAIEKALQG